MVDLQSQFSRVTWNILMCNLIFVEALLQQFMAFPRCIVKVKFSYYSSLSVRLKNKTLVLLILS